MLEVMAILEARPSIEFDVLLREDPVRSNSKPVIIATFLAILELTRLAAIRVYQGIDERGFLTGPIHLRRSISPGDSTWKNHIAELM
jgi:hypothetical protein